VKTGWQTTPRYTVGGRGDRHICSGLPAAEASHTLSAHRLLTVPVSEVRGLCSVLGKNDGFLFLLLRQFVVPGEGLEGRGQERLSGADGGRITSLKGGQAGLDAGQ